MPYQGNSDFCSVEIPASRLVYQSNQLHSLAPELETILGEVQRFFASGAEGASGACMAIARHFLCTYYYPPCGNWEESGSGASGVVDMVFDVKIPIVFCVGACRTIDDQCGPLLSSVAELFYSRSPPLTVPIVDCQRLQLNVVPLRHCCVDVEEEIQTAGELHAQLCSCPKLNLDLSVIRLLHPFSDKLIATTAAPASSTFMSTSFVNGNCSIGISN